MSTRRKLLEIVERMEDIPAFVNEAEEAAFWQTHRFSEALMDATPSLEDWEAPPARPSASITLRMDSLLLARLQRLAGRRSLPYQRLLKQFVEERLVEEEAAEAQAMAVDPARVREMAITLARGARDLERAALSLSAPGAPTHA
jgi:predicted DNA binding CopG/RHH family protein